MGRVKIDTTNVRLGALASNGDTLFRVWSPQAERLDLELPNRSVEMQPREGGYFEASAAAPAGTTYKVRLNGDSSFPDPASRYQPEGVHGPSQVIDPSTYTWADGSWEGVPREDLVFYELHVGSFSPSGSFDGVRDRLSYLKELGITAVELMPVADFPGRWNWGYDHAALYAPSRAYGEPDDLRRLVDEAHQLGLAVFLDVIYNHLGPDGAYVAAFSPMFTERHHTPWGPAINLDDKYSEGVRSFFIDNALHWLIEYHIDGLRLDATHALVDDSDTHFLAELAEAVHALEEGPRRILIAEDSRNLNTLVRPRESGGFGLDGLWTDDFHHLVRHITAGDSDGYYADFAGLAEAELAQAIEKGWYYEGQASKLTGKPRGSDASSVDPDQCVICIQNHDQIGNRPDGRRLNHDIPLPLYHAVSALLLFAPELPLLFMGQEWAASTPFRFFTDHTEELGRLVTEGRRSEFAEFPGFEGEVPDPQDPTTFESSRLHWEEINEEPHRRTLTLYRDLLALRKELEHDVEAVVPSRNGLAVRRGNVQLFVAFDSGVMIPRPPDSRILLRTDDRKYRLDGLSYDISDDAIRFSGAGAVVIAS